MSSIDLIFNESLIKSKLYHFNSPSRLKLKDHYFTNSAILFIILPNENKPYELIIIQRTNIGLNHPGEMAFPGGKFNPDKDKDLLDTVLRETEEEIGISRKNIKILGCLNDLPTTTRYIITPFIAKVVPDLELIPEEREVQDIIKVPIDFFLKKKDFKEEIYRMEDIQYPVFYYNYYSPEKKKYYLIWGATAKIIVRFINKVYNHEISELSRKEIDHDIFQSIKKYIQQKDKKNI